MLKSESIAALAAALSAVQGEIENAGKNSTNPHLKSRYADLAEILNTVRPVLSKHGLAVSQHPAFSDGMVHVETMLMHKSGEFISSTISTPVQKSDAQGVGSATTYARRYSLAAIVGLSQEDDDGHSASQQRKNGNGGPQQAQKEPLLTDAQRKHLMALYGGMERQERLADANTYFQAAKPGCPVITSFSELTQRQAAWLINQLAAPEDV